MEKIILFLSGICLVFSCVLAMNLSCKFLDWCNESKRNGNIGLLVVGIIFGIIFVIVGSKS